MPRASRHYLPGQVWHITHRCHKKEFLLRFARDRRLWVDWLREARRRFGLSVLDYMVTSNHIHLLIAENGQPESISKAMQLIAGRTGQEYNQRKGRKGAFWEDRYHATAIQANDHLIRCLVYIDLNMVRAGVVEHPKEWPHGGYREIQYPPKRSGLIDYSRLVDLFQVSNLEDLRKAHREWVEDRLDNGNPFREDLWNESVAVGDIKFTEEMKDRLGAKAQGRSIISEGDQFLLREGQEGYESTSKQERGTFVQKMLNE
jgi:putative transposase